MSSRGLAWIADVCMSIMTIPTPPSRWVSEGTLVAFTEARIGKFTPDGKDLLVPSCDDCVVNGIAQRRSTDGGRSWGEYTWAVSDQSTDPSRNNMDVGGNPSVLFNTVTNKLVLQFVRGMLYKKTEAQSCNPATTNWQQESSDAGLTWSKPVEISKDLGPVTTSIIVFLVHSKTLMECTDPLISIQHTPCTQCLLRLVASCLIYADVRTFRRPVYS